MMIDLEYCRRLVRKYGYPITVERYDSGQIGFIARPIHQGRRHNCSFSTSKYGTPEEAAAAAIEFCKEAEKGAHAERLTRRERYRIPPEILPQLSDLVKQAIEYKLDPIAIMRDGLEASFLKKLERRK
jgi:AP2 domain